jgi:hypothetical protein
MNLLLLSNETITKKILTFFTFFRLFFVVLISRFCYCMKGNEMKNMLFVILDRNIVCRSFIVECQTISTLSQHTHKNIIQHKICTKQRLNFSKCQILYELKSAILCYSLLLFGKRKGKVDLTQIHTHMCVNIRRDALSRAINR